MLIKKTLARLATLAILSGAAFAATVTDITYNHLGQATGFEAGGETYELESPTDRMTSNLQRWKDESIAITITDVDSDRIIEAGDSISES